MHKAEVLRGERQIGPEEEVQMSCQDFSQGCEKVFSSAVARKGTNYNMVLWLSSNCRFMLFWETQHSHSSPMGRRIVFCIPQMWQLYRRCEKKLPKVNTTIRRGTLVSDTTDFPSLPYPGSEKHRLQKNWAWHVWVLLVLTCHTCVVHLVPVIHENIWMYMNL